MQTKWILFCSYGYGFEPFSTQLLFSLWEQRRIEQAAWVDWALRFCRGIQCERNFHLHANLQIQNDKINKDAKLIINQTTKWMLNLIIEFKSKNIKSWSKLKSEKNATSIKAI